MIKFDKLIMKYSKFEKNKLYGIKKIDGIRNFQCKRQILYGLIRCPLLIDNYDYCMV